ncbi:MAG: hypothetical protein QW831_10990 [Candidatus Jordarchaeaceae archaeon]
MKRSITVFSALGMGMFFGLELSSVRGIYSFLSLFSPLVLRILSPTIWFVFSMSAMLYLQALERLPRTITYILG